MPSPSHFLRHKQLLPAELRTAEWDAATGRNPATAAWLKERAFFMAAVANALHLQAFRDAAAKVAAGTMSPSEARRHVRQLLKQSGYKAEPGLQDTVKDLTAEQRLKVSIDTNVALARGWAQHAQSMQNTERPAQELYRAGTSKKPRDWQARWKEAAEAVAWEGVARDGAMVALKTSPIWAALSRFGNPYPPFDFNSKMRVRSVSLDRARQLGLIPTREEDPEAAERLAARQRAQVPSLNERVEAPMQGIGNQLAGQLQDLLQGIAEWDAATRTLRMTDMNGTKPYPWDQIGRIISAPNPVAGNLQRDAAQAWMEDSNAFAPPTATVKAERVSLDMKEDFIRLMNRITPTAKHGMQDTAQETILRGLSMAGEWERADFLKKIRRDGYGARPGYVAESWTTSAPAAREYARGNAPVVLVCSSYRSRRRFDGLYKTLDTTANNPAHPHQLEGESLMPGSARFRFIRQENKNGTLYVYLEES